MRNMMNFKYLCDRYHLGRFQCVTELNPGTSSQVWQLETNAGAFLVRTLNGKEQGEREWNIHRHLRERKFTAMPAILVPYFEQDGLWYQVQEFCPGRRPSPDRFGTAGRIAAMVTELILAEADCTVAVDLPDRFDLASVWAERRLNWSVLELPMCQSEADRRVAELTELPLQNVQLIHGDLGLWNMLEEGGIIRVIDFGEARMGDPYFDLASALAGIINHSSPENRRKNAAEFLAACRERMELDMRRLTDQISLWVWRGMAQCVRNPDKWKKMAQRFYNALLWCEENLHEL